MNERNWEGFALFPSLSVDGRKLYYLLRAGGAGSWISGELWGADLESGHRQGLLDAHPCPSIPNTSRGD